MQKCVASVTYICTMISAGDWEFNREWITHGMNVHAVVVFWMGSGIVCICNNIDYYYYFYYLCSL